MFRRLSGMKKYLLILLDAALVTTGYFLTELFLALENNTSPSNFHQVLANIYIAVVVYILILHGFRTYNFLLRFSGLREYSIVLAGCVISGGIMCIAKPWIPFFLSEGIHLMAAILTGIMTVSMRVACRVVLGGVARRKGEEVETLRTLIIGAGEGGNLVIKDVAAKPDSRFRVVGLIDDNPAKQGCSISGIRVLGTRNDISKVCKDYRVEMIILAIPSLQGKEKKEILDLCRLTGCRIKVLPGMNDLILTKPLMQNLREIEISDLLSRDPVKLDNTLIGSMLHDKTVMVTGGGGSIGSELCRQIARFEPKLLVVLDIYENNAYDLENELHFNYPDLAVQTVIASVRDRARLEQVFDRFRPDAVFHAAAHKHVPLMEDNPGEAIKNNVFGTLNAAECAEKYNAKKFILISTDKAVNPTNVMGASKRICELIVQAISKDSKTEFALVRFGNVLGSNGSVIPLFKRQIANGGPITVTHRDITRYFMTIPEAAQLVLQAAGNASGGEIFVLDMGKAVKIYDLAENLIRLSGLMPGKDIEIKVTGLRPGEKLYEELLLAEEGLKSTKDEKIYIARPVDISRTQLKEDLKNLSQVIAEDDELAIKKAIRTIVPTYHIDGEDEKQNEQAAES